MANAGNDLARRRRVQRKHGPEQHAARIQRVAEALVGQPIDPQAVDVRGLQPVQARLHIRDALRRIVPPLRAGQENAPSVQMQLHRRALGKPLFAKAARHQAVVADLSGAQHAQAQQIGRVGRAQLPARRKRQHQPVQAGGRHGGQLFRKLLGRQRFSLPHHRIAKGIAARHIGDEDGARLDDAVAVHDARRDMHIFQARLVYAAQIQRVRAQGNPRRHALRGLGRKRKGKVAGGFAQRLRGDFRFPVAGRKRARRFAVDADFPPSAHTPRAQKHALCIQRLGMTYALQRPCPERSPFARSAVQPAPGVRSEAGGLQRVKKPAWKRDGQGMTGAYPAAVMKGLGQGKASFCICGKKTG